MKGFFIKILIMILYLIFSIFLAIQIAYFMSFNYDMNNYLASSPICFDYKIIWWQGNNNYLKLCTLLIGVGLLFMILELFMPSKKDREKRKKKQRLSAEDKLKYSHRSSVFEAKKSLQRIQFNELGNLNHIYYNVVNWITDIRWWTGTVATVIAFCSFWLLMMNGIQFLIQLFESGFNFPLAICNNNFLLLSTMLICVCTWLLMAMPISDLQNYIKQGSGNIFVGLSIYHYFIPHIRDYADWLYDLEKKWYNWLHDRFKLPANNKLNTLKYWSIEGNTTCRKAGLPILTKKRMMWIEPQNNHALIIGTTNSGKTFSNIEPYIEAAAMAGHSMVINDLKGELYGHHKGTLERLGYRIILLNWITPEISECWNPFGLVIKKYRQAQDSMMEQFETDEARNEYLQLKISWYSLEAETTRLVERVSKMKVPDKYSSEEEKLFYNNQVEAISSLTKRCAKIKDELYNKLHSDGYPHADFSEAFELLEDECRILCEEKDSKQPFFWQQAKGLMAGIVAFLLEYEYIDDDGVLRRLDDDQINFQNIKLMRDEMFKKIPIKGKKQYLIRYWLDNLRFPTDRSYALLNGMCDETGKDGSAVNNDVLKTFDNHIDLGTLNEKIGKLTSRTSFDFNKIAKEKTAVFLVVHDEKKTYYPFVTLFVTQLYNEIVKTAREYKNQLLPIPLDIIWDEFGISPALNDIESIFAASRFRGCRWNIVIQDYSQLDHNYGKDIATSIRNNIMNTVFLLASEDSTLKLISDKCGKEKKWNKDKESFDVNPVITQDELSHLSLSETVIIRQRKMPLKTRYYAYNRYVYYKHLKDGVEIKPRALQNYSIFSLRKETDTILHANGKTVNHAKSSSDISKRPDIVRKMKDGPFGSSSDNP